MGVAKRKLKEKNAHIVNSSTIGKHARPKLYRSPLASPALEQAMVEARSRFFSK